MENRKVKVVGPNKGKHMSVTGDINTILASKEETGGTYSFIEAKVFPGGGPIPHTQTREHEGFYIIEGQIAFYVNGQRIEAIPGAFVNVPPNVLHSFKNETHEAAKIIIVLSPAGMKHLFVEVGLEVSDSSVKYHHLLTRKNKNSQDWHPNMAWE